MSLTKVTVESIRGMKGKRPISALTAYDYPMGRLLDEERIDLLLVGDSLGMVVLGYPDTTSVTMEDMVHHLRAVARARPRGLLVADLPYRSYDTVETAVANARRFKAAGAEAVKAEGGRAILPQVKAIVNDGIPFLGHLGMLPQSVKEEGGYHVKGKVEKEHQDLLADGKALSEAGAFGVVLELVTPPVAAEMTRVLPIPTIGIGSGDECDGQILVTTDLLGTSPDYIPRHVKQVLHLGQEMRHVVRDWKRSMAETKKTSNPVS